MFDIIINPIGASGRTIKEWGNEIEPLFQKTNAQYKVYYSSLEYDVTDIVRDLTKKSEQRNIIIIGGDGSMNLAVNGICDFNATRIGFIPCGSGNDLALGLGISKNVRQCVEQILKEKVNRRIDVGDLLYYERESVIKQENVSEDGFVHHRFVISSGIGFDAHICQQAYVSKAKKILNKIHLGKLVYLFTAIRILASTKRENVTITIDGKTKKCHELLFTVGMNTPYEGGGFQFCPHAKEEDGLLDFCVGNQLSNFDFYRIFPYAYFGKHLKFKGVQEMRGKTMEIQSEHAMWVHTDGEVSCMSNHIQLSLLSEKLQMLN